MWLMFGNMAGPYGSNEWAFTTHIYEMVTLFFVTEINSVTMKQNCATIYNGTIIVLFIDIIILVAIWRWGRLSL
jgi:hypothetical protein